MMENIMTKMIDMTGRVVGRLTVLSQGGRDGQNKPKWLCRCSCGTELEVRGSSLRNGHSKSCGCLHKDRVAETGYKHGHSKSKTPTYISWSSMIQRCTNVKNASYVRYGGAGITVCTEWLESFETFLSDMGEKPRKGMSIERIDNNKGYFPENCKWTTCREQSNNTRQNVNVTYLGKTQSITAWCRELGLPYERTRTRISRLGWSIADAFTMGSIAGGNYNG